MNMEEIIQKQIEGTLRCPRCGSVITKVEWINNVPWAYCENEGLSVCLGDVEETGHKGKA
jgi:hypothetical protein